MKWIFKVNNNLFSKDIPVQTLTELNMFLEDNKTKSGFIEIENTLVNVNSIQQICQESKYYSGEAKI